MSRARDLSKLSNISNFTVDSDNNIGINSTSPDVKLDVGGAVLVTGISTFENSAESTSSTTGALIISGGVGIAKSLNVGGNISAGGTLTYEDVTNVDSVGIITARKGIISSGVVTATTAHLDAGSGDTILQVEGGTNGDGTLALAGTGTGISKISFWDQLAFGKTSGGVGDINTENLRIDSSGNVAIGTATAGGTFHVEKSGELNVLFEGKASTLGTRLTLKNNDDTANAYSEIEGADAGGQGTAAIRFINNSNANNEGSLQIYTRPSGGSSTERLRITSDGTILAGGQTSYDGGFTNLELRKDASAEGGSLTLVNDHAASASATCSISVFQNYRNAGEIVFGRENANNWQSSAAGAASFISFKTNNAGSHTERLRIDSVGRLLVGVTTAATAGSLSQYAKLVIRGDTSNATSAGLINLARGAGATAMSSGFSAGDISFSDDNGREFGAIGYAADAAPSDSSTPGRFVLKTTAASAILPTERLRVDSFGRLLVDTTADRPIEQPFGNGLNGAQPGKIVAEDSDGGYLNLVIARANISNAYGPAISLVKSRGTSDGSYTVVQTDDNLGTIQFGGADGAADRVGAAIVAQVDTTPGSDDMPGRLMFATTPDGSGHPTERLRVDSSGRMLIGAQAAVSGADANGLLQVSQDVGSNTCIIVAENTASSGNLSCFRARLRNSAPDSIFSAFLQCDDSSASKAVIRSNGGLANFSANNVNLSDRNAKKDITAAAGTWNSIKNWEIVNFLYKEQPDDADLNLGVIAQQIEEISPEMVTIFQQAKEATETEPAREQRLGVREQQMQWAVIKALQEAMARIETLETQNADLEARLTALEGS